MFNGVGCIETLVSEWDELITASKNINVVQLEYMGNPVSMQIRNGEWVIDFAG